MNCPGQIGLRSGIGQQGRDVKQTEDADWLAVSSGKSIAADENGEQHRVQSNMRRSGGQARGA